MATKKKLLEAAAGAAGGAGGLNVEEVFSTYLYTGNSTATTTQQITNGIDLSGEGGLVWTKSRTSGTYTSFGHGLMDTERGIDKILKSQATDAETTISDWAVSFNSDGFTLDGSGYVNENTVDYASWTFRKAPKFFDVVTASIPDPEPSTFTVNHNLGTTVGMVIVKSTTHTYDWTVFHRSLPSNYNLYLNQSSAQSYFGGTNWSSTDTTVTLPGWAGQSGGDVVIYLFAHNDGDGDFGDGTQDIIKCGSFTATAGTEVDLGFEPQWVIVKSTTSAADWYMFDNMRGWGADQGSNDNWLFANTNGAETNNTNSLGLTPTGFTSFNGGGQTYIYIAIRRGPMAVPTDATDVFAVDNTQVTTAPNFTSGFPVDFAFMKTTSGSNTNVMTRLMQGTLLRANLTDAEVTNALATFDHMDGHASWTNDPGRVSHMWRRAPSFCDVVAYTGNGTAGRTVSHNLGVAPEMMWVKSRAYSNAWTIYHSALGATKRLQFDTSAAYTTSGTWNNTAPTDSVFTLGGDGAVNYADGYIAYLFASVDGVSKVGSYTGNSGTQNIDCGFSSGARFVLIKRTSGTGNWHVFDTERGIVAGDDPRLELDTTDAEDTDDDYLDPYSSGFTVNHDDTFTTSINKTGNTYIFYAIA